METQFTAGQVLQIAEKLEDNGARFYTKMANHVFFDARRRELCLALAEWRARRRLALEERRRQFYEHEAPLEPLDSRDYVQTHPTILADLAVFDERLFPRSALSGRETVDEIVKDAIAKAGQALAFYQGLKDFAGDSQARATLDQVITEEQHYVDVLDVWADTILSVRRGRSHVPKPPTQG